MKVLILPAVLGLLFTTSTAIRLIPSPSKPLQPQCTYVTVVYRDAVDLASATNSIKSSAAFCSTPTSTSTTATSTTYSAPPLASTSILKNGNFEAWGDNALTDWVSAGEGAPTFFGMSELVGNSNEPTHSGNRMLRMRDFWRDGENASGPGMAVRRVEQTVTGMKAGYAYRFSVWARADLVFNDLAACEIKIGHSQASWGMGSITTSWKKFDINFVAGTTTETVHIQAAYCEGYPILYFDGADLSLL